MRAALIGFVGGAAVLQTMAVLPSPQWCAGAALLALSLALLLAFLPAFLPAPVPSLEIAPALSAPRRSLAWFRPAAWRRRTAADAGKQVAGGGVLSQLLAALASAALAAVLGFCWAAMLARVALAPHLAAADEGRDFTVVGTIDGLPYRFAEGVRFNFAVEQVVGSADGGSASAAAPVAAARPAPAWPPSASAPAAPSASGSLPPLLSLGWYAGFPGRQGAQVTPLPAISPGQRWQLTVRLQRPHGNANPYGFDYEAYLLEQGIGATGYVRTADGSNRLLVPFVLSVGNLVADCRAVLRERILRALPDQPYAGVIVALVVGDQRAIEQDDWLVFSRTGVSHLISISGLHITMVAGMAAMLASALWRRSFFTAAQLPLLLPAQKVAALAGAATALLYVLLAGFGVPAQRTLYMLAAVALAMWTGRLTGISQVLCCALALVVLLDPWAVLAPGFWLSFGAVGLILYANAGRTSERLRRPPARAAANANGAAVPADPARRGQGSAAHWHAAASGGLGALRASLRAAAGTQYVVTLGLVPLTLLLFAQVSLVSPLANALAIPLISFVVTPLALVGSVLPASLAQPVLGAAHAVVALLAALLAWLGSGALAVWTAPAPSPWLFAFALAGTLWLLAPRGWPLRWTGLAAWLPALTAAPTAPPAGTFNATVFDVGQGMAVLIETAHHRLLYDAGPQYSLDNNGGNRVLLPYLKGRGIGALDLMVLSHSDSDHVGGAAAVLAALPVAALLSSLPGRHPVLQAAAASGSSSGSSSGASGGRCVAGQHWRWDGIEFEILHPLAASYADRGLKPNARSCALRISNGQRSLLAAGDIEAAQESALLGRAAARLPADVLLAPHHGSGTSSTPAFLGAVHPSLALFQVGYRNRYRHPKAAVWERYQAAGIARLRTDQAGAVTLRFGARIELEQYRSSHARYWYARQ